jgi:hypothetical protein
MIDLLKFAREAVKAVPAVKAYLSDRARFVLSDNVSYKSYDYFLQQIQRNVTNLYNGFITGEFIDLMANLISGQIYDAYSKAWFDEGYSGAMPAYLNTAYQDSVLKQYNYVDTYYRAIVDARIDKTPLAPLLVRANMWASRWTESYQDAIRLITAANGGNLIWHYGEAEHCNTCLSLNGIVASAKEWTASGLKPKSEMLDCKGYNCKCELVPTKQRRSPKAADRILAISLDRK